MGEASLESTVGQQIPEFLDIRDKEYKLHWTPIGKLDGILDKGVFSPKFALRVEGSSFDMAPGTSSIGDVYLYNQKDFIHGDPNQVVGILIKNSAKIKEGFGIDKAHLRIAPRDFVALIVADEMPSWGISRLGLRNFFARRNIWNRVDRIRQIVETSGKQFTIYGNSGDMYWPKKMTRETVLDKINSLSQ